MLAHVNAPKFVAMVTCKHLSTVVYIKLRVTVTNFQALIRVTIGTNFQELWRTIFKW